MQMDSRPRGAQVYRQPVCTTLCTRALSPGSYALQMRKARYVDKRERMTVKRGKAARVSWELEPLWHPHGPL